MVEGRLRLSRSVDDYSSDMKWDIKQPRGESEGCIRRSWRGRMPIGEINAALK